MTPEGAVVRSIMDLLAAERIPAWRMNTGAIKTEKRFFRFGEKGMADILAWLWNGFYWEGRMLWIECKSAKGRQTEEQKAFEQYVKDNGMEYIVARSVDDVMECLENNGQVVRR